MPENDYLSVNYFILVNVKAMEAPKRAVKNSVVFEYFCSSDDSKPYRMHILRPKEDPTEDGRYDSD